MTAETSIDVRTIRTDELELTHGLECLFRANRQEAWNSAIVQASQGFRLALIE